ncbi:MAG: CpsD/CapB family tyrosine-protein kinase [Clostridia bacterium]|nr:CpsD/CapB family tyrosine-protein kinase [Clostridia bacterium]
MKKPGKTAGIFRDYGQSDKMFTVREAYRTIRTNIRLSVIKDGCRKIVFTSSIQGEGKTVTASNVAFSMSQTETKVLIIDADLRLSKVHKVLRVPNEKGLSNVLGRLCTFDEAVCHTKYSHLDVLCAGMKVPNPAELLASESMKELLDQLGEIYDCIIIDTPPVNLVSDAIPIIRMTDGVILVVRQNYATYPGVSHMVENLKLVDAKILGMVLNSVDSKEFSYSYRNSYKNGYGYGYNSYSAAGVKGSETTLR